MDTIKNFQMKDINMEKLTHKNVTIVFLQWEQYHQRAKLSLNTLKMNYAYVNILVLTWKRKGRVTDQALGITFGSRMNIIFW